MFNVLLKYDIYSKIERLDTRYKNHIYIKKYIKYKKFNTLIFENSIEFLSQLQMVNKEIDLLYYQDYIDCLYKEWRLESQLDLTVKYKNKIKQLKLLLDSLMEVLK